MRNRDRDRCWPGSAGSLCLNSRRRRRRWWWWWCDWRREPRGRDICGFSI